MASGQDNNKFVRTAKDGKRRKTFSLLQAFKCAGNGFAYTFTSQRNLKIQFCFAIAAILLGFAFQIQLAEWLAIVICIALVFALECVNTAIESAVDLVCHEWQELAMHAKDCAAAAVYVCAIASLVVAAIIFLPKICSLFM